MQNVIWKSLLLLAAISAGLPLKSQISLSPQVLSSGGKDFQNAQFQLTYTIGEMSAVSTLSAGNSIATQGFNQPDKFTVAFVDEPEWGYGISLFPNPAVNSVQIEFGEGINSPFQIEIVDQTGRRVCPTQFINTQSTSKTIHFNIRPLASGIYTANICAMDGFTCKSIRFTKMP